MKIETQPLENRQVKLTVEIEPETLEEYKRRAARKISKDARIPGFRPGKAPLDVIRRMYGDEAIHQQAIEMLVDDVYPKALDESKLDPSGPGSLEEIESIDPPKFRFVIPLKPEVTLGEYTTIRLPYDAPSVDEGEVDAFLSRMRRSFATAEPVTGRPVEKGDLVYVMLSGKEVGAPEGEEDLFPERPSQFLIEDEDQAERDWPFPGFSDELAGLNEGDQKTILHKFGEEDPDEKLRGKEVEFRVTVQSIKHLNLPAVDEEFARNMGEFESVEALRDAVRMQIGQNQRAEYDDKWFTDLIDQITEQSTIDYPPHLLEHEIEHVLEHLNQDLARAGMEMDSYLKMVNKEREQYIAEEVRPAAEKRLKRSLVLDEISHRENIQLSQEDMNAAFSATIQQLQQSPNKGKKDKVSQETVNNMTYSTLNRIYNQRILDRLKDIATGQAEAKAQAEAVAETEAETPAEPVAEEPVAAEEPEATEQPKEE